MSAGTGTGAGARDLAMLLLLACIWSSSFTFIKVGVATIGPATLTAGRLAIAAVLLWAVARAGGHRLPATRQAWALFTAVGLLGNALPFTLIAWGEQHVDSGLAAIIVGTMPVMTVALAHYFAPGERLTARRAIGCLVGFSGVVVLVGASALAGLGGEVTGQVAVFGGALGYAVTTVVVRRFARLPDRVMAAGTAIVAAGLMVPWALLAEAPWAQRPSPESLGAMLVLGLGSSGAAMLIYFHLVRTVGAAVFSQVNFLTPALGVVFGVVFLDEQPQGRALAALALILAGVWLVTRRPRAARAA